ncbi:hypothetical protein [Frankia sp. Cr1]|uniref:hypothetical protein n=1 Tax=Frankia sp. Cr1 TaxID=3073931 RepID=UPI002AD463C0|nr:hypothetical protein [Frankia sp. Cr1]
MQRDNPRLLPLGPLPHQPVWVFAGRSAARRGGLFALARMGGVALGDRPAAVVVRVAEGSGGAGNGHRAGGLKESVPLTVAERLRPAWGWPNCL